jgi:hypothetical protein
MRRRRRILTAVAAAGTVCALVTAVPPATAAAPRTDSTTTVTAYASADFASSGHIAPRFFVGGAVGGLLGFLLNPVLNGLINPLMTLVTQLPQNIMSPIAQSVNTSGLQANNPVLAPAPSATFTDCASAGLPSDACFDMYNVKLPDNPFVTYSADQTSGWTVTDTSSGANQVDAQSHMSAFEFTVMGMPLIKATSAIAEATCPTVLGQKATATSTLSGISMFDGAVQSTRADSLLGWLNLSAFNQSLVNIGQIVAGTFQGSPLSVALTGSGVWTSIQLDPYALFDALGLNVVSSILQEIMPGSDIKLQAFVGPGQTSDGMGYAQAWGNSFGIDLSAHFEIGIAGVLTVGFEIPTGIVMNGSSPTGGNLLGLKLAYAACTTNNPQPASAIPPGVN